MQCSTTCTPWALQLGQLAEYWANQSYSFLQHHSVRGKVVGRHRSIVCPMFLGCGFRLRLCLGIVVLAIFFES